MVAPSKHTGQPVLNEKLLPPPSQWYLSQYIGICLLWLTLNQFTRWIFFQPLCQKNSHRKYTNLMSCEKAYVSTMLPKGLYSRPFDWVRTSSRPRGFRRRARLGSKALTRVSNEGIRPARDLPHWKNDGWDWVCVSITTDCHNLLHHIKITFYLLYGCQTPQNLSAVSN